LAQSPCGPQSFFHKEGLQVALLGDGFAAMGGSLFQKRVMGRAKGTPPGFDALAERQLIEVLVRGIEAGLIEMAHDLSVGGLGMALVRACVGGPCSVGAQVELPAGALAQVLFSEDGARALVAVAQSSVEGVRSLVEQEGVPCRWIGITGGTELQVAGLPALGLEALQEAYTQGFIQALGLDD